MDVPRSDLAKRRRWRRALYMALGGVTTACLGVGLWSLKPAPPAVERSGLWIDTVRRGDFAVEVHGSGVLVPQRVRVIPAVVAGRVEQRPVLVGMAVHPDTVLLVLSNPQLEQEALAAQQALQAAEADFASLRAQLEGELLRHEQDVTSLDVSYRQAQLEADAQRKLYEQGMNSRINFEKAQAQAEGLRQNLAMARQQLSRYRELIQSELAAQQAKLAEARAAAALKQQLVEQLQVKAGLDGVLEELHAELGQQVQPGEILARVVDPSRLWAELNIPETEAKDVALGQPATIDTHNGTVPGHVIRIAPAPVNGAVAVDVAADAPWPRGARPNLSIEGTVVVDHLKDVLYVGRPTEAMPNRPVELFRLSPDGRTAVRVTVELGRVSTHAVQVRSGLQEGDRVILSRLALPQSTERIRIESR